MHIPSHILNSAQSLFKLGLLSIVTYIAVPSLALHAQEDEPLKKEQKLKIKKISEDVFGLGEIRINKKSREITFPANAEITGTAGQAEQPIIEYVLVNPEGKIHESLFITKVKPSHLNVAFKLLGYLESKELFRKVNKDFQPQEGYEKATPEQKKKSRFNLTVSWEKDGKKHSHTVDQLINNDDTKKLTPMEPGSWVYGGSFIHNGQFIADIQKDLFAIFTDRASLGNYAGKGREDDTLWFPNSKNMPAQGTAVTISITPAPAKKLVKKPAIKEAKKDN